MIFSGVAFQDCANPKRPIRATMIHRASLGDWGRDGIANDFTLFASDGSAGADLYGI